MGELCTREQRLTYYIFSAKWEYVFHTHVKVAQLVASCQVDFNKLCLSTACPNLSASCNDRLDRNISDVQGILFQIF